jgi:hypothetical protein
VIETAECIWMIHICSKGVSTFLVLVLVSA